jgi:hypothetical protein
MYDMRKGAKRMKSKLLTFFDGEATGSDNGQVAADQTGSDTTQVATEEKEDLDADFEALIKGKYKAQYDARFQQGINARHKDYMQNKQQLESLNPMLDMLKEKYGVSDVGELQKAIMDDDSYYEQEAVDRGMTVEQLKYMKQMERENKAYKEREQETIKEQMQREKIEGWLRQETEFKQKAPEFSLRAELANPEFERLLAAGVNVETAFNVIHQDEIMSGAMNYTAKKAVEKTVNDIKARGMRPSENGLGTTATEPKRKTVGEMTGEEILEMANKAKKGEKISF